MKAAMKYSRYKYLAVIFLVVLINATVFAQPSLSKMKLQLDNEEVQQPKGLSMKLTTSAQAGILFKNNIGLSPAGIIPWLTQRLALRQNEDQLIDENRDAVSNGYIFKKIHQYYKGIKVEHGVINITSRNNTIKMMQMEYYSIPGEFTIRPVLSEQQALEKAMAFTGGTLFAWTNGADTTINDFKKPTGELVIIQTYKHDGEVCLAYKFNIYVLQPLMRAYIYVNAWDGKVVLDDAIIKHAAAEADKPYRGEIKNIASIEKNPLVNNDLKSNLGVTAVNRTGSADTRFNGTKQIVTDSMAGGLAKPFRLREGRNGHAIITLNYQKRAWNPINIDNDAAAVEFTDNDNNWTSAEFNNPTLDDAALSAHYGMQWVSDYWYNIHQRNGWDDKNSPYTGYVHVGENTYYNNGTFTYNAWYNNAFWNGTNMHFGDGDNVTRGPKTYLDVCAHELSHAVTATTCALVYRWESGALNESLSDIWGACVTNYAITQDPAITDELVWRHGEKRDLVRTPQSGLRDLQNPLMYNQPSTYRSTNWVPGNYDDCPVENDNTNDHCGVHKNSGVFNKWFFLITQGEISINTNLQPYAIIGLGFAKTEKIAYMMEQNLTPNASFATAKDVSLNIAATEYGWGSTEYSTLKTAWYAVGVDTNIYNMANTPVFTTNNFTSIATAGTDLFAGTNYNGLYHFNDTVWTKLNELTDVRINDIKFDQDQNVWIAQSGRSGTQGGGSSIGGGVNYLKDPFTGPSTLYTVDPLLHVPSRNARCIYIDPDRQNQGINPKVWVATLAYITSNNSTSGMLGQGLYSAYKEFVPVSQGINIASGTVGCLTVGGIKNEVWTFVQANNGINQLLQYNAGTNALISTYDHNTVPLLPSGFVARAIYGDKKNRLWIGLANGGVMILDENKHWHNINFVTRFPAGTAVNYNAITGDPYGDVYIGTTSGIVFFDHGIGEINRLDDSSFYRLYTSKNGLPSSNINAIAYSSTHFKLYVATDSGIIAWNPLCIGNSCNLHRFYDNAYAESKANGNWSNPAVWTTGLVPDSTTTVVINDTIAVDIKAQCQSISVALPGTINVNTGKELEVFEIKSPIIDDSKSRQSRQR